MFANRPPPNPNRSTRASVGRHDSRLLTAAAARGMRRLPVRGTAQSFMGLSGLSGSNFSTLAEPPEDRRASAPINLAGGPRRRPLSATSLNYICGMGYRWQSFVHTRCTVMITSGRCSRSICSPPISRLFYYKINMFQ